MQPNRQPTTQPSGKPTLFDPFAGGSLNTSSNSTVGGLDALNAVTAALQSLTPTFLASLLANANNGRNMSSILKTLTLVTETVRSSITLAMVPSSSGNGSVPPLVVSIPSSSTGLNLILSSSPGDALGVLVSATQLSAALYAGLFQELLNQSSSDGSVMVTPKMVSDIISIQLQYTKANGSTSAATMPVFEANLQLSEAITFDTAVLRHNCTVGVMELVSLRCEQSHVWLNLTCTGMASTNVRRKCPVPRTVCSVLNLQDNSVASDDYCQTVQSGSGSVLCRCGMDESTSSHNRSTSNLLALNGRVSVAAFSSFAAGDFDASVSVIAAPLGSQVARDSVIVFLTFGSIWVTALFALLVTFYRMKQPKDLLPIVTAIAPAEPDRRAGLLERTELLKTYLYAALPPALDGREWWLKRFFRALSYRHSYLRVIGQALYVTSTDHTRFHGKRKHKQDRVRRKAILGVMYVLTALTMSCFVLAVLYDLQFPVDNGYCAMQADKVSCQYRKTLFDPWTSRCVWEGEQHADASQSLVAATLTESRFGKTLNTITVTPSEDTLLEGSKPCVPNANTVTLIAFVCSFVLTSCFAAVLTLMLEFIFDVLSASVSTQGSSSTVLSSELAVKDVLEVESMEVSLPERLRTARLAWSASHEARQLQNSMMQSQRQVEGLLDGEDSRIRSRKLPSVSSTSSMRRAESVNRAETSLGAAFMSKSNGKVAGQHHSSTEMGTIVVQSLMQQLLMYDPSLSEGDDRRVIDKMRIEKNLRERQQRLLRLCHHRWSETESTRYATLWLQYVFVLLLLMMHSGALYFLVSKAAARGFGWQRAFFKAVMWEWLTDICLVQSVECGVLDLLLPSWLLIPDVQILSVNPLLSVYTLQTSGRRPGVTEQKWQRSEPELPSFSADEASVLSEMMRQCEQSFESLPETALVQLAHRYARILMDIRYQPRPQLMSRLQRALLYMSTSMSSSSLIVIVNLCTTALLAALMLTWYSILFPSLEYAYRWIWMQMSGKEAMGASGLSTDWTSLLVMSVVWFTVLVCVIGVLLYVLMDVCSEWFQHKQRQRTRLFAQEQVLQDQLQLMAEDWVTESTPTRMRGREAGIDITSQGSHLRFDAHEHIIRELHQPLSEQHSRSRQSLIVQSRSQSEGSKDEYFQRDSGGSSNDHVSTELEDQKSIDENDGGVEVREPVDYVLNNDAAFLSFDFSSKRSSTESDSANASFSDYDEENTSEDSYHN
jgi:hypothetical protein